MPHVTSRDGTRIAFEESGPGPVVILVDGAMAHRGYLGMTPLAAELAGDFRAVAYDRRGRGDSVTPSHTLSIARSRTSKRSSTRWAARSSCTASRPVPSWR